MRISRAVVFSLIAMIMVSSGAFGAPAVRAANWANTRIVYLTGTRTQEDSATNMRSDYQWIYRSMKLKLGIAFTDQVVVNYTNRTYASVSNAINQEQPQVISSYTSGLPIGAPSKGTDRKSCKAYGPTGTTDAFIHAYQSAWRMNKYLAETKATSSTKVILIGHSQGGIIARILQLVKSGVTPKSIGGKPIDGLQLSCWPTSTLNKITNIVVMGAPIKDPCEGFGSSMWDERHWVTSHRARAAGRFISIGADVSEKVRVPLFPDKTIPLTCSTDASAPDAIRIALNGIAVEQMEHTWYIEGIGRCPKYQFYSAKWWCGIRVAKGNSGYTGNWNRLAALGNTSAPGNIYDVIATQLNAP